MIPLEANRPAATPDLGPAPGATSESVWALGDYHRFATATVWPLGALLVRACGIGPGDRVLDVAAGTGNTALRAAEAGASVVASDVTPQNFDAGRREAAARGVEVEWVEADARTLPFDDGAFDAVTSSVGAIFAPEPPAVAAEMARVCRPGGIIGMINFRPEAVAAGFFGLFARYMPPPAPGVESPLVWGEEDRLRALFGDWLESMRLTRGEYVERAPDGPAGYRALFESSFGPLIALRRGLAGDPVRAAAFEREWREFTERSNLGAPDAAAEYPYPYLLVVARRADR
jgi:ubiquinone/menaquinone biosynthesis C-methylase UbiE